MQQALKLQSLKSDWNVTLKQHKREFNTPPELLSYYLGDNEAIQITADPIWFNSADVQDIPISDNDFTCIANQHPMNDYGKINSFLTSVNRSLSIGDYYISCVEPMHIREELRYGKKSHWIRNLLSFKDFIIHRVVPRTKLFGSIYFKLTKGKRRVISLSESMARLCFNGFSIEDHVRIQNQIWIFSKKTREPLNTEADQRMLLRLNRIGYRGESVKFYKLRTMHPYSQYLQRYVYRVNGTSDGDKANNDFRVTQWGKFFRKVWIDELPMLINWVKGDVKLVGVRPLSEEKFNSYPEDLKKKRISVKPGLVPPFYAYIPESEEEFFRVEHKYIDEYLSNPIRTDLKYFYRAMYNIFFKGARSQ